MMRRFLRIFGLAPYSQVEALRYGALLLNEKIERLAEEREKLEGRLWARYMNRLKNDLQMSLSWFYSEHVKRVSLGIPSVNAAEEMWPYYRNAVLLTDRPKIEIEKL